MIDIRTCINTDEALARARKILSLELFGSMNRPVLLLLSGGSAFAVTNGMREDALPADLTIGMLDERYSSDSGVNNFAQFMQTELYGIAAKRDVKFIDSRVDVNTETLEAYTARLEAALRTWVAAHPDGRIIITQGVGTDGHTAGIMPYPEDTARFGDLFENANSWVVGYDAGDKNTFPLRATVTMPFLREAVSFSLLYATGEEKRPALERLLLEEGTLAATPARIIREMNTVILVTTVSLT